MLHIPREEHREQFVESHPSRHDIPTDDYREQRGGVRRSRPILGEITIAVEDNHSVTANILPDVMSNLIRISIGVTIARYLPYFLYVFVVVLESGVVNEASVS